MKTNWKWDNILRRVTAIDRGNARITVADVYGYDYDEIEEHGKLIANALQLHDCLADMCYQFAYWNNDFGGITTGGLGVLEEAFELLGWDDPHKTPHMTCDEPGCNERASGGTPTKNGYRYTCFKHCPKVD